MSTRRPGSTPTIDAHAHLISEESVERLQRELPGAAPVFEDRPGGRFLVTPAGRVSGPLPPGMTDLGARLADMDRTGVDMQLVSPSPAQFGYRLPAADRALHARIVNDASLSLARAAPDRVQVLLVLPLPGVEDALAELERLGSDDLVRGVEIGGTIGGVTLDDPAFEPLWAELARRRLVVLVHAAPAEQDQYSRYFLRNLVGNPADSTLAIASLVFGGVAERHPTLVFCFVHGGGFAPYQIGRWDRGWNLREDLRRAIPRPPSSYLGQFYFDTLTHDRASLEFLGERVGWSQVVLGSDYCFDMASDDPVADVRALGLDPAVERDVLGGTLERILARAVTDG